MSEIIGGFMADHDAAVNILAALLEEVGFQDAKELLKGEIVPDAQIRHISLIEAAWSYANQDEEQDTTWYQLFHALQAISAVDLSKEELTKPL
jgi:hypothetical protein